MFFKARIIKKKIIKIDTKNKLLTKYLGEAYHVQAQLFNVAILAGTAILSANTALAADNATIEEVQVTGSYIK